MASHHMHSCGECLETLAERHWLNPGLGVVPLPQLVKAVVIFAYNIFALESHARSVLQPTSCCGGC